MGFLGFCFVFATRNYNGHTGPAAQKCNKERTSIWAVTLVCLLFLCGEVTTTYLQGCTTLCWFTSSPCQETLALSQHLCPRSCWVCPVLLKPSTSARGLHCRSRQLSKATFDAISKTCYYLTPDVCKEMVFTKSPYQELTNDPVKAHTRVYRQRIGTPAIATDRVLWTKNRIN